MDDKEPNGLTSNQNGLDKKPEQSRPGVVQVSSAAPQGKLPRQSSKSSSLVPIRSEAVVEAGRTGLESNLLVHSESMEPEILIDTDAKARPEAALSASMTANASGRTSRRADSKAAIRQEMNALRSQGIAQGPGAIAVSADSTTPAAVAFNSKSAIKQEMEALGNNPEIYKPGAHSVVSTSSSCLDKGRAERPSRRAVKENEVEDKIKSSKTQPSSSSSSKPGAIPSTTESTAAAEKAMVLKTEDALKPGAVHTTEAGEEKGKMMKVDSALLPSTSNEIDKKVEDGKVLEGSKKIDEILNETSPKDEMSAKHSTLRSTELVNAKSDSDIEGDLVAAQVIDEEELEAQYQAKMMKSVVAAEIVSDDEFKERGRCWKMSCCCLLIVSIVMAIAIPLSKKEQFIDISPTQAPTEQSEYDYLYDLFFPYSGEALSTNSTSQYRALQWIAFEDPLGLPIKEANVTTLLERYALVVFYYSTGGEEWTNNFGFLSNTSICEWGKGRDGVLCDEQMQHMEYLDFTNNNLKGTIPTEFLAFSRLGSLYFVEGGLTGTLPSELGDMTSLTALQFPANKLTGTIPSTYSRLALRGFNVDENQLTGTIASEIFLSQFNLQFLALSNNQFQGSLPQINRQSALKELVLYGNNFEGTIPSSYFEQGSLSLLGLSDNKITGTIPQQIRALEKLSYLYASKNLLNGTIPSSIAELRNLEELLLGENKLTGTIPSDFGQLQILSSLILSDNPLTGTLPPELGNLGDLSNFDVSSTGLTGTVPLSFSEMTSLTDFGLLTTNIIDGLQQAFCAQSVVYTSIKADCLGDNATIPCDCCSTCCGEGGCESNLLAQCEARSAEFIAPSDRGTSCDCQQGGAKMSCTDTLCESCNLDGSICARSTDYGYIFNETTGTVISFRNVLQYTKGRNDSVIFTKDSDETTCDLEINGQRCKYCGISYCGDNEGFSLDCSNLEGGPTVETCATRRDVEYLEVFYLADVSLLSGCAPVLIDLRSGNDA